jgi:DNA polymerase III subunit epsilon
VNREIVFDTETTGLDPAQGDRVVEIGCVELLNHVPTGRTMHVYLNPERDMPEEAFRVHGLSSEFLSDKPLFSSIAKDFLDFVGDATLVAHNANFDVNFLNAELTRVDLPVLSNAVIDTVQVARRRHPGARVSLDALCKHYGIDNSRRTLHGALLDSEILAEVYLELIGGRQVALALSDEPLGTDGEKRQRPLAAKRPVPLSPRLTEAGLEAHAALVKSLGPTPLWHDFAETAGPAE